MAFMVFKCALINLINNTLSNSSLNLGGIYFVLKDVFGEVEKKYFLQISQENKKEKNGDDK